MNHITVYIYLKHNNMPDSHISTLSSFKPYNKVDWMIGQEVVNSIPHDDDSKVGMDISAIVYTVSKAEKSRLYQLLLDI